MLPEHPELIPAIGYYRVSTWHEEKISDEIQKTVIAEAARRRGRRIVAWIPDLDATGRNFKRRIMEAIEAVETGSIEGAREIWVWKFSRFGRSRFGVAVNLARIEQAGGELISATEDVDSDTAVGEFTRDMLFAIAAFESNRAGEQWREAHTWRRNAGLPANGSARFAYLWTPRLDADGKPQKEFYEPDPDSYEECRRVYERYADGAGFLTLAKELNGKGLLNPHPLTKGGWSYQSVSHYMDTGFAAGLLHVHGDAVCPERANCPAPREHYGYIPGAQPPILSDELWLAYQQRRKQRKALPPRSRIPKYPFTGVAKCGLCGGGAGAYNGPGYGRGYGWRCTKNIGGSGVCTGASVTTSLMVAEVKAWLERVEAQVDGIAAGSEVRPVVETRPVPDTTRARERLAERVRRAAASLDTASRSLARGIMPEDSYLRVRDELLAEQREAEVALAALVAEVPPAPGRPSAEQLLIVRRLREEWGQLPVPVLRDMLLTVTPAIKIFPKSRMPRIEIVPTWERIAV
jgi:DNA invertase Pin-like site-specific DNA recombinase